MRNKGLKIYLDHNASTPCDPNVSKLFQGINREILGNPHSTEHSWGWDAEEIINTSKAKIAEFLNAFPDEIIFTSGASEANNLALIGTATTARLKKITKNKIIVSAIEHKCVLNAAYHLHDLLGFNISIAPVNHEGVVNLEFLEQEVDDNTLLVSIMGANNEIGTYQPLSDIGKICKKHGAVFHVDAAQSAYQALDVIQHNIDLLSLSAHKVYGPKGIGALYINQDIPIKPTPIIHGGGQQDGFRSGTLSPALSGSMAKAISLIIDNKTSEISKLLSFKELFLKEITQQGISFEINGEKNNRHPGNLNIQFHNIDARMLITRLQPKIALSTGSACNSGEIKMSYVLKALGLSSKQIESSVRLAFGRFNTQEEIIIAAQQIALEIKRMHL